MPSRCGGSQGPRTRSRDKAFSQGINTMHSRSMMRHSWRQRARSFVRRQKLEAFRGADR